MAQDDTVSSTFESFAQHARERADKEGKPDRAAETEAWIKELKKLYATIDNYFKKFVSQGLVEIQRENIDLYEELLGQYSAPKMIVNIGDRSVQLVPIGTYLIGAKGRVDIRGDTGEIRLVRVRESVGNAYQHAHASINISTSTKGSPREKVGESQDFPEDDLWVWKITTPPPASEYVPLNSETFLEAVMGVSGA